MIRAEMTKIKFACFKVVETCFYTMLDVSTSNR